ncbi:axin [Zerene cesonia]|uniref:axin n=1 Tax=Zerene cesonia TaxID=33412 RepID=UPI0018E59E7A|nr:axin [Zerene cesonia]
MTYGEVFESSATFKPSRKESWEHKLADRSSLPPAPGEEKGKSQSKHVFTQPHLAKAGAMWWREETEGSSGSSARSPASPPYVRWARALHFLLEDAEGVRLFRKFVCGAGGLHVDRLNFYFAVHGLRQETEPPKIRQVVSAIYKFLRKSQLTMPEALKTQVKQALKDGASIEKTIFDEMEQEVTRAITETTYQAFLRSEAYVSYVSAATQPLSSPDASPPHRDVSACGQLATLHEGQELGGGGARLTHDALLATQSRRLHEDVAPRRCHKRSVYSAHVSYAGYTPTSRQDSERASLSSGRTDSDAVSLSGSSVDGMSMRGARDSRESRHRQRLYGLDRQAVINKEQDTAMMIPRTARGECDETSSQVLPPQLVAAAIREKLQPDDDNDQDILDQHVSRVWSERTPGASPPGGRRRRPPRRAPSCLSADSGHCDEPPAAARRSTSKKAATELTDSGVSVVSEGTASGLSAASEPRILLWIAEGERLDRRASSADRRDRRPARSGGGGGGGGGGGSKSSSTSGGTAAEAHTVVVAHFLDESVPYRFKVPASPLTLRTFKEYLPRKGNYRYFFKTECADLDNTVIQEEVSSDSDTLPMFEGKVMARVKSID